MVEVEISVRVAIDDDKIYTILFMVPSNASIQSIIELLEEQTGVNKYKIQLFFEGKRLKPSDKLGAVNIGKELGTH